MMDSKTKADGPRVSQFEDKWDIVGRHADGGHIVSFGSTFGGENSTSPGRELQEHRLYRLQNRFKFMG